MNPSSYHPAILVMDDLAEMLSVLFDCHISSLKYPACSQVGPERHASFTPDGVKIRMTRGRSELTAFVAPKNRHEKKQETGGVSCRCVGRRTTFILSRSQIPWSHVYRFWLSGNACICPSGFFTSGRWGRFETIRASRFTVVFVSSLGEKKRRKSASKSG